MAKAGADLIRELVVYTEHLDNLGSMILRLDAWQY